MPQMMFALGQVSHIKENSSEVRKICRTRELE